MASDWAVRAGTSSILRQRFRSGLPFTNCQIHVEAAEFSVRKDRRWHSDSRPNLQPVAYDLGFLSSAATLLVVAGDLARIEGSKAFDSGRACSEWWTAQAGLRAFQH
jgi:hypothetical protein